MASKNLIIGAFTDYNYNQLKPWCESIPQWKEHIKNEYGQE
jgi:hypothetical protein